MKLPWLKKRWSLLGLLRSPIFKVFVALCLLLVIGVSGIFLYYYHSYSEMIDRRLAGEIFQRTASLYAAPYRIYAGQNLKADAVVARLQRAGFEPQGSDHASIGTYELNKSRLSIKPSAGEAIQLQFEGPTLATISKSKTGDLEESTLPPELVTGLSDNNRQKRRIVEFKELPPMLVNALIAAEDNRFYSHHGIDPIRLAGAFVQSFTRGNRLQGTSTITQQFSRNFFLTTERTLVRKTNEIFISLLLEQRLTKQQILTLYCNDVYLGARGSYSIKGFGEGAAAYFGKDLTALTLPEAATLAAIIPAPSGTYSPIKHPDRAKERRDMVLNNMVELGFIKAEDAKKAKAAELKLAPFRIDSSDAPYLVDYIHDSLLKDFSEDALNNDGLRVETTLDPDLQKAAVEALTAGLKEVNDQVAERNKKRKPENKLPDAQAAIIVLDRKTAGISAMAGGGDYGVSQLNRVTQAFRQPGSIFKPLVYAAAFEQCEHLMNSAGGDAHTEVELSELEPGEEVKDCITPTTIVEDVETTFTYDKDKIYEPNNYHAQYNGEVTVRYALEHSLNVPTIKVAEAIGYDKVADLARRAGLNAKIKGYPSVALGAFEVTPIEMAGAYTIFANEGVRLEPHALARVLAADGSVLHRYKYPETRVLSPQVAYMMTYLMEGVIRRGTAVSVRDRFNFDLPAAGKTGTSRDGWFAGYTKDYIVIAWVGFDDNTDLNIEGAHSALPIWAQFMKKAHEIYPPRDVDAMAFTAPDGIKQVTVEKDVRETQVKGCTEDYVESYLEGTVKGTVHCGAVPENAVSGFFGKIGKAFGRIFGKGPKATEEPETPAAPSTSSH
jgi:penicillin-binding protein 1B